MAILAFDVYDFDAGDLFPIFFDVDTPGFSIIECLYRISFFAAKLAGEANLIQQAKCSKTQSQITDKLRVQSIWCNIR